MFGTSSFGRFRGPKMGSDGSLAAVLVQVHAKRCSGGMQMQPTQIAIACYWMGGATTAQYDQERPIPS